MSNHLTKFQHGSKKTNARKIFQAKQTLQIAAISSRKGLKIRKKIVGQEVVFNLY